jgi:hypothetical protein
MTKILTEETPGGVLSPAKGDTYPVVLITPGQGTSGYYREDVIREYAPEAFPKGTHVYLDHLKEGEQRTPEKLLGYLTEDTVVNEQGEAINQFKPLKKHREWIEEIRGVVGLSVAVAGEGSPTIIDGRQTLMVESLTPSVTNTVDLVSYAGRGGRFLESYLQEANSADIEDERTQSDPQPGSRKEIETMAISEEQVTALVESVESLVAALTESKTPAEKSVDEIAEDRKAAVAAVKAVESADISDETKAALIEGIEAGDYDVAPAIEREKALTESIRARLEEQILTEAGASAKGNLTESASEPVAVKGW